MRPVCQDVLGFVTTHFGVSVGHGSIGFCECHAKSIRENSDLR